MASRFDQKVYQALKRIPRGTVTTYGALARVIGKPRGARAVGQALGRNPHPVRVPCHRVVRADGRIGGYAGGTKKKIALLRAEGIAIRDGRVKQLCGFVASS